MGRVRHEAAWGGSDSDRTAPPHLPISAPVFPASLILSTAAAPEPDLDPLPEWISAREKGLLLPPAWAPPVSSQPRFKVRDLEDVGEGGPSFRPSSSLTPSSCSSSSSSSSRESIAGDGFKTAEFCDDTVVALDLLWDPARGAEALAASAPISEEDEDGEDCGRIETAVATGDRGAIFFPRLAAGLRLDKSLFADPSRGKVPKRPQPAHLVPNYETDKLQD